ncbi:class I SAM-dependent methyltransferase [Microbacteriaceae bacterium 4G12]
MAPPHSSPHPTAREHPGDHERAHAHAHGHESGTLAELLDLDASVLGSYLGEAMHWLSSLVAGQPRRIVDLGAGTGVGAFALARHFPSADVIALDRSAAMLGRVEEAARGIASATRVRTVQADVDAGWPAVGPVDLVWSSSALHEVADPGRVLREVRAALRPGGLVVLLELDGPARVTFGSASGVDAGWEERLREAEETVRGDTHADWRTPLEDAGLPLVGLRTFAVEVGPGSPDADRYARLSLEHFRPALQDRLDAPDLAALDALLAARDADAPLPSGGVRIRTSRTAWVARRP